MDTNQRIKKVELVPVHDLKPNPKNRNRHSKEQISRLASLIEYQGFRLPIVVSNRTGYMVAGHGRLSAAKEMGLKKVPASFQDFDNEEQEYAFMVSDNAIAEWADLDLSLVNGDLGDLGPDFDIDLLGIKDFVLEPADKYKEEQEDVVPEVKDATTKPGDLWILGDHRVLCGDCTDPKNIDRLMNGEKADMVFTDPPYNLASDSKNFAAGNLRKGSYGKLRDSAWDKGFSFENIKAIEPFLSEYVSVYVCTSHFLAGQVWEWLASWANTTNYCVWAKPNPMPSLTKKHWTWSTELICYGTKQKNVFNFPANGHAKNVWEIQKNASNDLHPTMKPVGVPEHAITHSSNPGMLVWDGFLGSGSTLIACEKTNRKCYGMEIDPHYCDVIVKRWEDYTGNKAVLDGSN